MNLTATNIIERPELTFPKAEADWLRDAYTRASSILEYGSGGSTVMASEMAGKTVMSVESDGDWVGMMNAWFHDHPALSTPTMHHANVGKTGEWGMPEGDKRWRAFPKYPLEVWDLEGFVAPDVVLVDGRFRVGCLLACLYRTQKPIELYFDDYIGREPYHVVESFITPTEIRGRMARFDLNPTSLPSERLLEVIQLMTRPR